MLSTLLEMSLAGGCLILVVIVLRALLLHRLPKALFFWLWMLALLRLLLPVFPASPLSVFARAPVAAPVAQQAAVEMVGEGAQATRTEAAIAPAAPQAPPAVSAQTAPPVRPAPAAAPEVSLTPLLTRIWLTVSLLLALLLGLAYARGLRNFRRARPLQSPFIRAWLKQNALRRPLEVRLCARIDSPMTYGVLRPVILLPESVGKADTQALLCALEHELSHIRHFDAVWKPLIAAAVCLHWFNPLVWAMAILAGRDIELCCDARVLRRGGKEERRAYASALLRMEEARAHVLPLTNAFSRNALEERIGAIMNAKKISVSALLLTLLIAAVALTAFAAAPESGTATLPADTEMTHAELVAAVDAAVDANAQYRGVSTSDLSAYAPYGLGALTGLRAAGDGEDAAVSSQQWYPEDESADALVMQPMYTQEMKNNGLWIDDPDTAGGINIAETGYAAFGITTEQDLLLHDGEYVRYLEDEGANIHYENDGGTLDLYAVRDESGALTGLRAATEEEYDANTKQYMVW